jgi:hypothetical protein
MSDSSISRRAIAVRLSWEKIMTQHNSVHFDPEILPPLHARARAEAGDIAEARARLEALAHTLDSAMRIPGTSIRIGADAALNLIPGIGTLAAKAVSGYLIWEARRLGVPTGRLLRMVGNVASTRQSVRCPCWAGSATCSGAPMPRTLPYCATIWIAKRPERRRERQSLGLVGSYRGLAVSPARLAARTRARAAKTPRRQ